MPLSSYGRDLYADVIVGITSAAPSLWLVICGTIVTDSDTGATLNELSPRFLLIPGSGTWEQTSSGVRTYTGVTDFALEESDPAWGNVSSYAIVDSPTVGTGNVIFYGTISPSFYAEGPMILSFTDLVLEVPA
jgi:hypothetical protein